VALGTRAAHRRRKAAAPPAKAADIIRRLEALDPGLAISFRQVLADLDDASRATFMGPVGEAREVFRAAVHRLAPDDKVKAQTWFKGDNGRPTQAERARCAAEQRIGKDADEAADAVDTFEAKLGTLFRTVYSIASGKFHTSTQRAEAKRIVGYGRSGAFGLRCRTLGLDGSLGGRTGDRFSKSGTCGVPFSRSPLAEKIRGPAVLRARAFAQPTPLPCHATLTRLAERTPCSRPYS
jgi:hypothetical protein